MSQCRAEFHEGRETFFCVLEEGHADEHRIICYKCQGTGHQLRIEEDRTDKRRVLGEREVSDG